MNIYKLEQTIKEVKAASQNPKVSRKQSWELHCLYVYLQKELDKLYFMRTLNKEMEKVNEPSQRKVVR